MMLRTLIGAVMIWFFACATEARGEVIHLKNGRILIGTALAEGQDDQGFRFALSGDDRVVYLKWSQVCLRDRNRLLGRGEERSGPNLIDGVRIITASRIYEGVLLKEDETDLTLKNVGGIVKVPKVAVERRLAVKIAGADIYSSLELLKAKESELPAGNPDSLLVLAQYARSLKLYSEAVDYLEKALEADPSREQAIAPLLESLQKEIQEDGAIALMKEINTLMTSGNYAEAEQLATKLMTDFASTSIVKANAGLVEKIKAEGAEFLKNREKVLPKKVADLWKSLMKDLIGRRTSSTADLAESGSYVAEKLDDEIIRQIAKQCNIASEEVVTFWEKREMKDQTASYGSGSWLVGGGRTGYDYEGNIPEEERRLLQTDAEWWKSASSSVRREWLTSYYVETSKYQKVVQKKTDTKCSGCAGKGRVSAVRGGNKVDVICPRCHDAKNDIVIIFQ